MVRITIELIRKRSEHNEGEISTLEEITLHQENIEQIELLNRLCKDLRILLLQNNLISKIENLNRLKLLEYLNLALNNIEIIENLEGLESLRKLDLTVNFIGDARGVKKLRANEHLQELFLTGNPCTDYEGYREYVVASLPQLKELDGQEITRSERIKSLQRYSEVEGDVIRGYRNYERMRNKQLEQNKERATITEIDANTNEESESDEEATKEFWNSKSYHTPEDRCKIAEKISKIEERKKNSGTKKDSTVKHVPKLFTPEGRPYNINQAKIPFRLNDQDNDIIILEIAAYRHLDTSLLNVDVQPNYVRVTIKSKILQLSLPYEVLTDKSTAKRNTVTGNLEISMPRLNPLETFVKPLNKSTNKFKEQNQPEKVIKSIRTSTKRELLEIGPPNKDLDFSNIYQDGTIKSYEKPATDDFVDNPEVPPLE